jgi:hypothetical protein
VARAVFGVFVQIGLDAGPQLEQLGASVCCHAEVTIQTVFSSPPKS